MAKITFTTQDQQTTTLEATSGSVMELAVANTIKGIDGDCGGVCSCATCHVHVAAEDMEKIGQANTEEADMLEFADGANEYSRLSCQIAISDAIDGVKLTVVN